MFTAIIIPIICAGLPCRSATAEPNHWQYRWQQHDGHGCQRNKALKRLVADAVVCEPVSEPECAELGKILGKSRQIITGLILGP